MLGVDSSDEAKQWRRGVVHARRVLLQSSAASLKPWQASLDTPERSDENQAHHERQQDRAAQHLTFDDDDFVDDASKHGAHDDRDGTAAAT